MLNAWIEVSKPKVQRPSPDKVKSEVSEKPKSHAMTERKTPLTPRPKKARAVSESEPRVAEASSTAKEKESSAAAALLQFGVVKEGPTRGSAEEAKARPLVESLAPASHKPRDVEKTVRLMGAAEEWALLERLENNPALLAASARARRMRRKLLVRRLKRTGRVKKLFDLDRRVTKAIRRTEPLRYRDVFDLLPLMRTSGESGNGFRERLHGREGFRDRLIDEEVQISPYTFRRLKPYIRRDYESRPLKLRLLEELAVYHQRKRASAAIDAKAVSTVEPVPLDYCYMRREHLPYVNHFLSQFFWPGIDSKRALCSLSWAFIDLSVAVCSEGSVGFS